MKTPLLASLTIIFVISLSLVSTAFAQSVIAGVAKGETFDYDYYIIWSSTNPSASMSSLFVKLNETQQVQLRIDEVSDSRIDLTVTKQYSNGTQSTNTGYIDIATGTTDAPYGFLIMRTNVNINEQVYPSGGHQTITNTFSKSYQTGQRETSLYIVGTDSGNMTMNVDKLKGIAIDYLYESQENSDGYTTTIKEVLINTNSDVWTVAHPISTASPTSYPTSTQSSFPTSDDQTPVQPSSDMVTIVVLVVVIIVAVIVVLLLVKGRGKRKSRVDEEFAKYIKPSNS